MSVIICTRNRRDLVTRAIDSVLAQEDVATEIIVVDDCSDDDTATLLADRYGERVKLVCLDENRRVAFATNRGFAASSGDYIAMLGDDDYWSDPKKLRKQLDVFANSDTGLGVVGTWWSEQHASGERRSRQPEEPENWANQLLQGGGVICGSTPLISREAWTAAGGLDERMPRGTDSDLFRRIVLRGYEGSIVREDTTVVDVGHGLARMTTAGGFREARRTAYAHSYLLWKYRRDYLRHPRAMLVRLRSLLLTPLLAILR
ncbi:MAG: glycosyltransferase family A protein [Woeseiaceae bacterium]|nr:glycosyltransferase family A protein [Woeseiaceae bacterium]